MDFYTLNTTDYADLSFLPLNTDPLTNTTTIENLVIGTFPNDYKLPNTIGAPNQVMAVPVAGNELVWTAGGGGGGDIVNGGQNGVVVIGSNDNSMTLRGFQGIKLEGGLDIQYNDISSGVSPFILTDAHQFVEISNPLTTLIELPEADTRPGKQYIISKGYSGGTLTINTQPADKIDGQDTLLLNILNERVSLISSGIDRWLII